MTRKTTITAADIIDQETYAAMRKQRRAYMIAYKKNRRLSLGSNATIYFEDFETMLYQVQEMLHTEKGGKEQLVDELAAYNPLIPQGNELVGTFMLEFENPKTRPDILRGLTGIEETININIDGEKIAANWERDVDRTAADGKTSSIHFIRFRMNDQQAKKFCDISVPVTFIIDHVNYSQSVVIDGNIRKELARQL